MEQTPQYIEMGMRIRKRREELGITQTAFAQKLNISNTHLSSIENGQKQPGLDCFLKICHELSLTPDDLLLKEKPADSLPQSILDDLTLSSEKDLEQIFTRLKEILENKQGD